jgi:YD repeat-containing protein
MRYRRFAVASLLCSSVVSSWLAAQTATYHVHKEASAVNTSFDKLLTSGPDAASVALTTTLTSKAAGEYVIKEFETQTGVPNAAGVIPTGSTLSFSLWMRKTANVGTVFPRAKVRLNSATGTLFCTATGATALTTTVAKQTISCTTTANITMAATDRFYLWTGVNLTATSSTAFSGELDIEGTLNGNFDSQITLPTATGAPSVSSLTPNTGATGSAIVIAGANFRSSQGSSTVTFNGVTATASSWSTSSITATVPGTATTGTVVVTVGGQASTGVAFTVTSAPSITSLTPNTGAVGSSITIAGGNFGGSQGNGGVKFNGTAATITSWSASSIVATVPAGATTGNVIVTAAGGVASAGKSFTVTAAPSITSLTPNTGPVGSSITIAGSNFGGSQGNGSVKFNGTTATITSWSASSIVAVVPAGATTGNVVVTAAGGVAASGVTFTVTPAPSISSLTPSSGAIGSSVTIAGTNFGPSQGNGSVKFNGKTATITSWSATSIVATVATGTTTGNVVVTAAGGVASAGVLFTVTSAPNISSLSPTTGAVGTTVTISGTNFGASTGSVTFNGSAASPTSWGASSITVAVPAAAATTGNVVVTAAGGVASNGVSFTVPPSITGLAPTSGIAGTPVTISGNTFGSSQGTSTVTFNGAAATPTSWGATSIVVPVPGSASSGNVVVTVGGLASNGSLFTFIPTPVIGGLSPATGPANTQVTVSGSHFGSPQGTGTISFNGVPATVVSWGDTAILAAVPAGATSGQVVVSQGGFSSPGVTFTVVGAPSVSGLSPNTGGPGTPVVISGANFGLSQGSSVVRFNGVAATAITNWTSGSITATAPGAVSSGPVVVTVSGQNSNGQQFTAITTGTLSGTVTKASDGTAINGALIEVLRSGVTIATANSGSTGSYSITNASAGTYDLRVSNSGFGTALQNAITISGGQTTTANFTLSSPGSVTGRITQADGITPISGAALQLLVGSAKGASATTDATGSYSLNTVNAGSYSLQASASGFVTRTQTNVVVAGGLPTSVNLSLQPTGQGPINYVYDSLGRLTAAIDTNGDAAIYNYDSAGNILSIVRRSSAQTSIISFLPKQGPVGGTVTIYGTGFSSTPAQNTVQLNGTTAAITSATPGQLVVSVPAGATTGAITVTSPSGSATSASVFTVTADSGSPTITSFTPTVGIPGTAITITGTNFDLATANDKVRFNVSGQSATTASATSVTAPVPANAGSGHISVTTPKGKGTSSQDFFVPFNSHAAADVVIAGRITSGVPQTPTLSGSSVAMYLFDATAGQTASVTLSGSTIGLCRLFLLDPHGAALYNNDCSSSTIFIDGQILSTSGTYALGVDPSGTSGSVSITLNLATDIQQTLVVDGPPLTAANTAPGQNIRFSFSGFAGQHLNLLFSNITFDFNCALSLVGQDGTHLTTYGNCAGGQGNIFVDILPLPKTQTYNIIIDPGGPQTGSITAQLSTPPPDVVGSITIGGPPVAVNTPNPGQYGKLTFTGNSGQRVSLNITNPSYPLCVLLLLAPNGTNLVNAACGGQIIVPTLPTSGTYTIVLAPQLGGPGSATVVLNDASDLLGSITADGTPVTVNTPVVGQDARLSFSGTAGQRVSLLVTNVVSASGNISLLRTDGSTQSVMAVNVGSTNFMAPVTLTTTGTYSLLVAHNSSSTTSETLQLYTVPPDVTGTISIGGPPVTITVTTPGQNASLTFGGTAGQNVSFAFTNGAFPANECTMQVLNPDSTVLANAICTGTSGAAVFGTLGQTGTYTLKIQTQGGPTGSVTLQLFTFTNISGTITIGGPPVVLNFTAPGQTAALTFNNNVFGQLVDVWANNVTIALGGMNLTDPFGQGVPGTSTFNQANYGFISGDTLNSSGIYTLHVNPNLNIGNVTVSIYNPPQNVTGTLIPGTPVTLSTAVAGQNIVLTFSGTAGQQATVHYTNSTFAPNTLVTGVLRDSSGNSLTAQSFFSGSGDLVTQTLPTTGTYTVLAIPAGGSVGGVTVNVTIP